MRALALFACALLGVSCATPPTDDTSRYDGLTEREQVRLRFLRYAGAAGYDPEWAAHWLGDEDPKMLEELMAESARSLKLYEGMPAEPRRYDIDSVYLSSVEGMHGGWQILLRADGTLVADEIDQMKDVPKRAVGDGGLTVHRKTRRVSTAQVRELEALLERVRFFSIRLPYRSALPSQAMVVVRVRLKNGVVGAQSTWEGDRHPGVGAVARWLLDFVRLDPGTEEGTLLPFSWDRGADGGPYPKPRMPR